MDRSTFLKNLGLMSMSVPFSYGIGTGTNDKDSFPNSSINSDVDEELYRSLVLFNDIEVRRLLNSNAADKHPSSSRGLAHVFNNFTASFCCSHSSYYQDSVILSEMEKISQYLLDNQLPNGTINSGNLTSPPDTSFVIWRICSAMNVMLKNNSKELNKVKRKIKRFIIEAGDALTTGGVHTANHRWDICSALAKINALYPNKKYVKRLNDWLGEGIYNDKDGHYLERSRNYGQVIDHALIDVSRWTDSKDLHVLDKEDLLDPVRRNLKMTYYYMDPNGNLATNDSRRQDQKTPYKKSIVDFYIQYRYMAIKDGNKMFSAITKLIERLDGFRDKILSHSLLDFMAESLLQKKLPQSVALPTEYEKFMSTSSLARIRHEDQTTTIFGGVDWPMIIASGRSHSPDFFNFRKGKSILKYMRFSPDFFSRGLFRSKGLKKEDGKYILHHKQSVPYYQPLPKSERNENGKYKLSRSIDGRFWNMMSFKERATSNVQTLDMTISIEQVNGGQEVIFDVFGSQENIPLTIELCFKNGGQLYGVVPSGNDKSNYFLKDGMTGKYKCGDDYIKFGPGVYTHNRIYGLASEEIETHNGNQRTDGMHVYLTGKTPFNHKITFR